jgi:hypothetical protein
MVYTSTVNVSSIFYKLLEAADIVKKCYHISYPLLIARQSQRLRQMEHLFAGSPSVVLFELQIGIDVLIITVKAGDIIGKPGPEFLQPILLHNTITSKKQNRQDNRMNANK